MQTNKESIYMQWAKTRSQAKYNLASSGVMHYPLKDLGASIDELEISGQTIYGYEPLKKALAAKCGAFVDCVATAIGTSMANHIVLAGLLEPEDEVLIEEPTYEPLLAVARYLNASIKRFPRVLDQGFRVVPEEIRRRMTGKTKLIVITNLHNPTGVFTDRETMKAVGDIANESTTARVFVDEVYLECLYPETGNRLSAFHLGNRFVTTSSLTKAYGLSGLRCGWILAEPDLVRTFQRLQDLFYATPPFSTELLSVIALQKLPQIGLRAKRLLETNRKRFEKILDLVNYFLDLVHPEYGTIVFPRLKSGNADPLVERLRTEYDTSVVPGSFFERRDHFRIGLGGPSGDLEQGLANLQIALEQL